MKKLLILLSAGLMTGSLYAACMGPFCWDERGAYVNGSIENGNGDALPSMTLTQINAAKPDVAGQEVYCSNCTSSAVCVSSGTGVGAYTIAVSTSAQGLTHCQ